jgi:hypothetical protein
MLGENGRLKGDLTILNWGDGTFWIMGSYYLRQWHMRWFEDHALDGATLRDISDATGGFAVVGPNARAILQKLTHQDLSNAALPFMGCTTLDLGLIRAKVARMSVTGRTRLRDQLRGLGTCRAAQAAAGGRRRLWHARDRLQRGAVAAAGERASASGHGNSPKATRRAKPG